MMKIKNLTAVIILLNIILCSAVMPQIVVNEIMYVPADAGNEWFEIYNAGNSNVNIQNWKWKDATSALRTITSLNILINSGAYIVICQDSVKFKLLFPGFTGLCIQTVWSQLNNSGDNLILISSENNRVDSVTFLSAWGGSSGGYSLEKKISNGNPNSSANWSTSVALVHSTPGIENSVTPKQLDLFLKTFEIDPAFPVEKDTLKMKFTVKNPGVNAAENFSLKIYADLNKDSTAQNNELIHSKQFEVLFSEDSLGYSFSFTAADTGRKQFVAEVNFSGDNDTLNNKAVNSVYVSSEGNGISGAAINEIMYDPFSGYSEWIEVYNSTSQILNIKGWKYRETSTPVILFNTDTYLNPGDFLLIAHDSTVYNSFPNLRNLQQNQKIKFISGIGLSNAGETISITDSLNNVISSVSYSPDWHNQNFPDTKGISLEKINYHFSGSDAGNWSSCTRPEGGTPGFINSIFTESKPSNSEVSVYPNPFSPDGDGFEDFTIMKYKLNTAFAQMRIKIFDFKGRLVRTLSDNKVSGNEGSVIFNGLDESNNRLRIGIYILLIEAIDDKGGTVDIQKSPFVIASKL